MTVKDIKQAVIDALSPLNVPLHYLTKFGSGFPYFTFFILSDKDVHYGDGDPIVGEAHIQLDTWGKGDIDEISNQAKELLKNAGFRYQIGRDFYEKDTQIYHRVQQFSYFKEM